jgi:proteasome lid subunit RPN8/RPN11
VRRRIDVDEALPPVAIPGRILNELCAHALETLPEECCGLIVGDERQRFVRLVRCRNEMTRLHHEDPQSHPRDGRSAFWMNEGDYLQAREQAAAEGQQVTAVYHSHVGVGSYLSEEDLAYAEHDFFPFPEADQLVVAVFDRHVKHIAAFQRPAPGQAFVGRAVEARES